MSSNPCSLALDLEDEIADETSGTLTLLVNKRYVLMGSSSDVGSSHDVIELGGTITVSF